MGGSRDDDFPDGTGQAVKVEQEEFPVKFTGLPERQRRTVSEVQGQGLKVEPCATLAAIGASATRCRVRVRIVTLRCFRFVPRRAHQRVLAASIPPGLHSRPGHVARPRRWWGSCNKRTSCQTECSMRKLGKIYLTQVRKYANLDGGRGAQ